MKFISLLITMLFCGSMMAQNTDLSKMEKSQRDNYLVNISTEVIKRFGPGYYRENVIPKISEGVFKSDSEKKEIAQNVGREYYLVSFPYDKSKETLDFDFSAEVKIWKDTGEPLDVIFGNGYGRNFMTISYKERIKDRAAIEQIPYQQVRTNKAAFVKE